MSDWFRNHGSSAFLPPCLRSSLSLRASAFPAPMSFIVSILLVCCVNGFFVLFDVIGESSLGLFISAWTTAWEQRMR